jgi:beta-1,4-mannosyl-glycoprotein beta-1,4-N-acetylglucosaminyltransferase
MIYDTFIFFNELELLQMRLHELNSVVDRFVLVEATRTHSNMPKPLYFREHRETFRPFLDKIIYVVVEEVPVFPKPSLVADFHRDALARGLIACKPDDFVMLSDVDEIPRAESVSAAVRSLPFRQGVAAAAWHWLLKNPAFIWTFRNWFKRRHPFVRVFIHTSHKFFLNCVRDGPAYWCGTRMVRYRDFSKASHLRRWKGQRIENAGWHFSSMGGVERVQAKVAAFTHQEFNQPEFTDSKRLAEAIQRGHDLNVPNRRNRFEAIDASYPAYLRANLDQYKAWIRQPEPS